MAEVNPCFVLTTGTHGSEIMRSVARSLRLAAGVVDATDLTVSPGTGMQVSVSFGRAIIDGTESTLQGSYVVYNDAAVTKAIATADGSNPRIDLVVARVHDKDYSGATYNWAIEVVTGTPAVSPAVPATPANAIVLAQVLVPALAASIASGNITDKRSHVGLGTDATQLKGPAAAAALGARSDVARLDHIHPFGTNPYKARAYNNATQGSVASLVWTKVALQVEDYDPNGNFDNATNYRYTAAVAGYYFIAGVVAFSLGSQAGRTVAAIYKNGVELSGTRASQRNATTNDTEDQPSVPTIVFLNVGDYIELFGLHSAASPGSFSGTGGDLCSLTVALLSQ